jgi:hypothetical protein
MNDCRNLNMILSEMPDVKQSMQTPTVDRRLIILTKEQTQDTTDSGEQL